MQLIAPTHPVTLTPETVLPLLQQYRMFPQLIREILIDQAIQPFSLSPQESLEAYQQFYKQHQLKSEAELQTWLQQQGMTRDQLEHWMSRKLRIEKFKHETWDCKVENYFLKRKTALDRVIYSLIRVKDADLAQELYFRIEEGEQSFSEVARLYSQGVEAQTGGILGPVEVSVPHPILSRLFLSSQPRELSRPTQMLDWFVLVRVEQFLPAQLDEPMRSRLRDELFEEWINTQLQTQGSALMEKLLETISTSLQLPIAA